MFSVRSLLQFLLVLLVFMGAARAESNSALQHNPEARPDIMRVEDILALNTTMRSMLDLFVKPIPNKERRAQALYNLMFGADKFALKYDNSLTKTKTAIETIESGSGNCVSLSNTFIAMARYVGLEANYLDVAVPTNWERESDVYYQMKHVSASVKIRPGVYLGIEYKWMGSIVSAKTRIIEDHKAYAAFFSNRGVEFLAHDNDAAIAYLMRSIELDPDNASNWSNLGVAYRRVQRLNDAEYAYLQALKKNKADLTAINNLVILYQMTGREKLVDKYSKKLERYRMQNPYYLIDLAKKEMQADNYPLALSYAKRAIDKYSDEDEFYFIAAQIYAHQGDMENAKESLENAERYALSGMKGSYSRKLELLAAALQAR
jgi:tetratricopeptide (TPR) repeat protein